MFPRIAFGMVGAIVLGLAACGDGGPPDAAIVYGDAGDKMAALTSYHVTVEGLDEGEPVRFEADLVPPDRFQFAFTEDGESFEIIGIGDQLYVSPPESSDFFIAPEEFDIGDMAEFFTALTTEISDLTYLGEETVDGVATHHLRGTVPPDVLALVELEEEFGEGVTVELWVGKEDSLVRRYLLAPSDPDQETTLTLSRFDDEAISIEAPANPRPFEELEELAETRILNFEGQPFETPEDVKEAIESLSDEERDCLRRELGDTVFEELEAGARLPTQEEFRKGDVCFE